jgi:two-component system KDP operon response regulator KdpE
MNTTAAGILFALSLMIALALAHKPLGDYMYRVFTDKRHWRGERAIYRLVGVDGAPTISIGEHIVDFAAKTVCPTVDHEGSEANVHLTPTEWQMLEILLRKPGKLITQRYLLTEVWGPAYLRETHYLRQYMAQLRNKLEPDPAHPRHLLTELGMGYRFQP